MIGLPETLSLHLRRLALALALLGSAALVVPPSAVADERPSAEGGTAAARTPPPVYDRSLMLMGCMGGLALGAVSIVLPPVGGWVAAGVWMGGLGTMVVRGALGCGYGGLAAAVASSARATVRWSERQWRSLTEPAPIPRLPLEGTSGT